MIRTKDRFYWKDLLYLSRAQDGLRCVLSGTDYDLYQCAACSSLIRFKMNDPVRQTGQWYRIKPYEFFQLVRQYPAAGPDETQMEAVRKAPDTGAELHRCRRCASYWWKEQDEWTRADDEQIDAV